MTAVPVTINYPKLKVKLETDDICFNYLKSLEEHLFPLHQELLKNFKEEKYKLCADTAHSLKGMLSYLDILSLETLLIQLEKLVYQSTFQKEDAKQLISAINPYLKQIIDQVKKLLKRPTEPA